MDGMAGGSEMQGVLLLVGGTVSGFWMWRRVLRAFEWNLAVRHLIGASFAALTFLATAVVVTVASEPDHWLRLSPVVLIALVAVAALCYFTRGTRPNRERVALAADAEEIPAPQPSHPCVALIGFSDVMARKLEQLCESKGFTTVSGPHAMAVFAIAPDGSEHDEKFAYPTVSVTAAESALQLLRYRVKSHPKDASLNNLRMAVDFARDSLNAGQAQPVSIAPPQVVRQQAPEAFHAPLPAAGRVSILGAAAGARISFDGRHGRAPASSSVGITLPCLFRFSYRDQDGGYAVRRVNVNGISKSGGVTYLEGFCQDRMDCRTFRTDRIRGDLTDMDTGELVRVTQLLGEVRQRHAMKFTRVRRGPTRAAAKLQTAVLFTGFSAKRRVELEEIAEGAGWCVRKSVGPTLDYLVAGPRGGPAKLAHAEELGVPVLDEDTFLTMAY